MKLHLSLALVALVACSKGTSTGSSSGSTSGSSGGANGGSSAGTAPADSFAWAKTQSTANTTGSEVLTMTADANGVLVGGDIVSTTDITGSPRQANLTRYDSTGTVKWSLIGDDTGGDDSSITSVISATNTTCSGDSTMQNCIYVAGTFTNAVKLGDATFVAPGLNGFVALFLDAGDHTTFVWSKYMTSASEIVPASLAFGRFDNLLVSGWLQGATQFGSGGTVTLDSPFPGSLFVASFSLVSAGLLSAGAEVWAQVPAAAASIPLPDGITQSAAGLRGAYIATDASANVYVATSLNPDSAGESNPTLNGAVIVNKYTESATGIGGAPAWSVAATTVGPAAVELSSVAVDSSGDVIIIGATGQTPLHFNPATTLTSDNFIAKLHATDGSLAWATGYTAGAIALTLDGTTSYVFGNASDDSDVLSSPEVGMGLFKFDSAGTQQSLTICGGANALGQGVASHAGAVYVGGILNHPGTFGTLSVSTDGVFTAKLK